MFPIRIKRTAPVLVYQMGKVGSSSLGMSLSEAYPGVTVNSHDFSASHDKWMVRRLHRAVAEQGMRIKIISLVREPIGRNVSAFFENFERDAGVKYWKSELTVGQLRALFLENYRHELPLVWFENHIEDRFGIDVYASSFPESGHATYASAAADLLVVRSEIPDAEKEDAIRAFLDLHSFRLLRANVGDLKVYADTYRDFKQEVRFPADYVDRMCNSRYFQHFYSQEVIEGTRRRWTEGPSTTDEGNAPSG